MTQLVTQRGELAVIPPEVIREFCMCLDPQGVLSFSRTNKQIQAAVRECWESILPHLITHHFRYQVHPEMLLTEQFERLHIAESSNARIIQKMTLQINRGENLFLILSKDGKKILFSNGRGMLLWDLIQGETLLRVGENEIQNFLLMSVDGKKALSIDEDGERFLTLWDLNRGEALRRIPLGIELILLTREHLYMSRDGKRALFVHANGMDGIVKFWDLDNGEQLCSITTDKGYKQVGMDSDGKRVFLHFNDGRLQIWDLTEMQCIYQHESENECKYIYFGCDAKKFLAQFKDKSLLLFDLISGKTLNTTILPDFFRSWSSFEMNHDGTKAIAIHCGDLQHWDLTTGIHTLLKHSSNDRISSAKITPNGGSAVSLTQKGVLQLWDLHTGKCLQAKKEGKPSPLHGDLQMDDYGMTMLFYHRNGEIGIWNLAPLPQERLCAVTEAFRGESKKAIEEFYELPRFVQKSIPRPNKITYDLLKFFGACCVEQILYGKKVSQNFDLYIGKTFLPEIARIYSQNIGFRMLAPIVKRLPDSVQDHIYGFLGKQSAHAFLITHTQAARSLHVAGMIGICAEKRFINLPRSIKELVYREVVREKELMSALVVNRPNNYGKLAFHNKSGYHTTLEEKIKSIISVWNNLCRQPS